ncbi:MAG: energy-coupling factor transporter transmembrane protein EcfT [Lachnospiraceae bacterium]|nr:energy-coupling factor transporter transmembrane protein EcfT [Lachnospiraceae bacterium]
MQRFNEYHPIINLIFIVIALIITMSSINPYTAGLSLFMALLYGRYLYGKKYLKIFAFLSIPVIIFAAVFVPLFSHNGETALFYINDLPVTLETILFGLVTGMMMLATISWFYVAGSMIDTEKFLYLTGRLLPTIALIISMTIGMIPKLIKKYKEVSDAQAGIGRNSGDMSVMRRIQFMLKKLSIVISWTLEDSVNTTVSMESRGYGTGKRTNAHLFKFIRNDRIMLVLLMAFGSFPCTMAILGKYRVNYFPSMEFTEITFINVVSFFMFFLFMGIPMASDIINGAYENSGENMSKAAANSNERRDNNGR